MRNGSQGGINMADKFIPKDSTNARLDQKASQIIRDQGPLIHHLLADMNHIQLADQGKLGSAEIGRRNVRWKLEWQAGPVSYKMHVVIGLKDDGISARIDRVLVQREASTPFAFEGHTPTTTMRTLGSFNLEEIRRTVLELWPK